MKALLVVVVSLVVVALMVLIDPRLETPVEPERQTSAAASAQESVVIDVVAARVPESAEEAAKRVEVSSDEPASDSRRDRNMAPGFVSISVRDASGGDAAGIPLIANLRLGGTTRHGVWRGVSDADGVAVAGPFETSGDVEAASVEIVVQLPVAERPRAELRLDALPAEPIVLTLPPHGAVDVELDYPVPARLEGVAVRLMVEGKEAHSGLDPAEFAQGGRAAFEHVGVGLRLWVHARLPAGDVSARTNIDGPVDAGQRVLVRLSLGDGKPILVADLVDEHGEPLRSASLTGRLRAKDERSSGEKSVRADSDGSGRLYLAIRDRLAPNAQRSLRLTRVGEPRDCIDLELPALHAGENHLGVLTMLPPEHLCSGTVVDRAGAPVGGASIVVQSKSADDPDTAWRDTDLDRITSSADGTFRVQGRVLQTRQFALAVDRAGFLPLAGIPFALGAEGLLLVLDGAATLSGQVLLDAALWNPWRFRVEVRRAGANEVTSKDLTADGRFSFDDVASGLIELRLFVWGDPVPLFERALRIDGPVDLEAIDLRGALHRIEFQVADIDGKPVEEASAMLIHERSLSPRLEGLLLDGGHGEIVARHDSVGVLVFASGYRVARIPALRDGDRIVLEPRASSSCGWPNRSQCRTS